MLFKSIKSWNTPKICFAMEALLISNFLIIFQQCMVAQVTNFHGYSPKRKIIMAHTETGPYDTFGNVRSWMAGNSVMFWVWTTHFQIHLKDTVDGSEIIRSPVEVGSLSHYSWGFIHPRWLFGSPEPSRRYQGDYDVFFLSKLRDLLQGASTSTRALPHKVHAQLVALPERQDVGNATHSTRNLQNMLLSAIFQYLLLQAVTWQCLWHFLELGPSVRHDQSTYPLPLCNLPEKWWLKQALIPDVIREHLC